MWRKQEEMSHVAWWRFPNFRDETFLYNNLANANEIGYIRGALDEGEVRRTRKIRGIKGRSCEVRKLGFVYNRD